MWRLAFLAIFIACTGCEARQPESARTVAAFEVLLSSDAERSEFLALLRKEATAEGLHVDADSADELKRSADVTPQAAMTVHATAWRGAGDDQPEATIMDWPDHPGRIWIMFGKGEDPALARRFRDRLMTRVYRRWPDTLTLPILPTGGIPNSEDLRRTPHGYEVDPAAAFRYALPEPDGDGS